MSNQITKANMTIWKIDGTGTPVAEGKKVCIKKVLFFPTAINEELAIQHADGTEAIPLKSGSVDTSPVHLPFDGDGLVLDGMKIATLTAGALVYIYLAS